MKEAEARVADGRFRSYGWRAGFDVAESQRSGGRKSGRGEKQNPGSTSARWCRLDYTHTVAGSVMRWVERGRRWVRSDVESESRNR